MRHENYVPYIDETSKIDNLKISINNINIRKQTISDLQINFGKNNVGKLTFLDYENIAELVPLTFSSIYIQYNDFFKNEYKQSFICTKTDATRYKDGSIKITVYFENSDTYLLKNTYISKTFSNKTIIEMLDIIFQEIGIKCVFAKHENDYVHENFVFPKNISLWDFLNKFLHKEGYSYFHDRISLKILSRKYLETYDIPKDKYEFNFKYDTDKPHYNILEYQGCISNSGKMNSIPVMNKNIKSENLGYTFNFEGISNAIEVNKMNSGYAGMGNNVQIKDFYPSIGVKESDILENYFAMGDIENDYRDKVLENSKLNIVVQGVIGEMLFHRIKVNIGKSKNISFDNNDQVYSQEYIVTEVIDKIISGVYVQVFTLQSADYSKGDENVW
jgi:hypothetical protein